MAEATTSTETYVIQEGSSTAVWGTDGVYAKGIIKSATNNIVADKTTIADNNGNTAIVVYFNKRNEFSLTILHESTSSIPAIGDSLTIDSVVGCIVEEVSKDWTQGAESQFTVTAVKYVKITPTT